MKRSLLRMGFLSLALALAACAGGAPQPQYATPTQDLAAKRFTPEPDKARVYAITSYWRSCSLVGCIDQRFAIPASFFVGNSYAGALVNVDSYAYADVAPGSTVVSFRELKSPNEEIRGGSRALNLEAGRSYFVRLRGGNGPGASFGLVGMLVEDAVNKPFNVEVMGENGRESINTRRLIIP